MGIRSQQPPPDAVTLWGHQVKGLAGILNCIDRSLPWAGQLGIDRVKEFDDLCGYMTEIQSEFHKAFDKPPTQHNAADEPPINAGGS